MLPYLFVPYVLWMLGDAIVYFQREYVDLYGARKLTIQSIRLSSSVWKRTIFQCYDVPYISLSEAL